MEKDKERPKTNSKHEKSDKDKRIGDLDDFIFSEENNKKCSEK